MCYESKIKKKKENDISTSRASPEITKMPAIAFPIENCKYTTAEEDHMLAAALIIAHETVIGSVNTGAS